MIKDIFTTRLLLWAKQWKSLFLWALFPLILTVSIILLTSTLQEETKIPVGIVLEEETPLAMQLYNSIKETPHIRTVLLDEREAIDQTKKHKLDSVFIIKKGYDKSIERGSRNELIKSYSTDFSFAYIPLKELLISYVQQDFSRSNAAYVIKDLHESHYTNEEWIWLDLINRSKEIEREQNLLETTMSFENALHVEQENNVIDSWTVWILTTFLATFLIFDWTIKENKQVLLTRLSFSKVSFKRYLVINMLIYTIGLLLIDFLTIYTLSLFFEVRLSFVLAIILVSYRFTINIFAFLFSLLFKATYSFYIATFMLSLIALVGSGAIIPLDGLYLKAPLIKFFNPLQPVLSINMLNHWLLIAIFILMFWFMRKEEYHA